MCFHHSSEPPLNCRVVIAAISTQLVLLQLFSGEVGRMYREHPRLIDRRTDPQVFPLAVSAVQQRFLQRLCPCDHLGVIMDFQHPWLGLKAPVDLQASTQDEGCSSRIAIPSKSLSRIPIHFNTFFISLL
jgi:hypothetical protein